MTSRLSGFSTIELMVTLLIFTLILLMGAVFTRAWGANAHINTAEAQLRQAFYRTRSLALRNSTAASGTAATMIINGTSITVRQASAGTVVWTGSVDSDITILIPGCGNQVQLDSNALPVNSSCLSYQISASGGDTAASQFY